MLRRRRRELELRMMPTGASKEAKVSCGSCQRPVFLRVQALTAIATAEARAAKLDS